MLCEIPVPEIPVLYIYIYIFLLFSEKITIYFYKSNGIDRFFRGMPVVLNLTDSNCFLRCCKEGESVHLQVEVINLTE